MATLTAVVLLSVTAIGGCGDDEPTRDEFVEHMMETTVTPQEGADGERWRAIYGCTYDEIAGTDVVDQLLEVERGDAPSEALSATVSKVLGDCLTEVPPAGATTVPPGSTTVVSGVPTAPSIPAVTTTSVVPAG